MNLMWEKGIDVDNAVIHLYGEVDFDMYSTLSKGLTTLNGVDNIYIILTTYGGDAYLGFAIYDLLRASGQHITILCNGPVMSAGVMILQAAHTRLALPNAQLMVHYGEDSNDSVSSVKHNADMLERMKKMIGLRASVTKRTLNKWFNTDAYFNTTQALRVGLIDRVVENKNELG